MKNDPRPACRFCGRRWAPVEGVDAIVHYCDVCSFERRQKATLAFEAEGKQIVRIGGYFVRAAK